MRIKNSKQQIIPCDQEPAATMTQQRLAAIDVGTNTIRCIIVEVDEKIGFRVLDDEKSTVRRDLDSSMGTCPRSPVAHGENHSRARRIVH
jgi:exopolyphosphatase/guanosine-5'-triphosphate,3'-diphosphate pyrophosphatase